MKSPNYSEHFYSARSYSFAEYWKYCKAHFDGLHAAGYHSAETEPILVTIFTNFAYNNVDRCRDVNFSEQNFEYFLIRGRFSKKRKNFSKCSNYGDLRPPELRNDNRSPETHGQNKSLLDV